MKKRVFTIITALWISTSLPAIAEEGSPSTEIPTNFTSFTGRVTGSKVRLRTQPTLEGHVLRETKHGEMIGIVGEKEGFYAVQSPRDIKGYVFRTFILDGVVEGDNVNIRLHPDVDAPVIGKLARGQQVETSVCAANSKWLEVDLPSTVPFYIAKEYVEKCGPLEMLSEIQQRKHEATCHLNSAFHFAQAEMQKSFSEIDLDTLLLKFTSLATKYPEFPEIIQQAKELGAAMQEQFLQKKIAFLESKSVGEIAKSGSVPKTTEVATMTASTIGLSEAAFSSKPTEKMLLWQPLEESVYHLWMATHGGESMDQFYAEEKVHANVLTGTVESYNKPVKNRPGDFLLKEGNMPVAFLYSTQVDLEQMVGKKVTMKAAPCPNNNFAFPAYFVLSVE